MSYVDECLQSHIDNMRLREDLMEGDIRVLQAEHKLLKKERLDLQAGLENWQEESENN